MRSPRKFPVVLQKQVWKWRASSRVGVVDPINALFLLHEWSSSKDIIYFIQWCVGCYCGNESPDPIINWLEFFASLRKWYPPPLCEQRLCKKMKKRICEGARALSFFYEWAIKSEFYWHLPIFCFCSLLATSKPRVPFAKKTRNGPLKTDSRLILKCKKEREIVNECRDLCYKAFVIIELLYQEKVFVAISCNRNFIAFCRQFTPCFLWSMMMTTRRQNRFIFLRCV